jgi:hypothetical protein
MRLLLHEDAGVDFRQEANLVLEPSIERGGVAQQGAVRRESHFGAVLANRWHEKRPKEMVKRLDGPSAYECDRSIRACEQTLQSIAEGGWNDDVLRLFGNLDERTVDIKQQRGAVEIDTAGR